MYATLDISINLEIDPIKAHGILHPVSIGYPIEVAVEENQTLQVKTFSNTDDGSQHSLLSAMITKE